MHFYYFCFEMTTSLPRFPFGHMTVVCSPRLTFLFMNIDNMDSTMKK